MKKEIEEQAGYFDPKQQVTTPDIVFNDEQTNAPPLEMGEDDLATIMEKEGKGEEVQEEVKSATKHFLNGTNEWQLIAKTYNDMLMWEHTTTAMAVGDGVLVCVKEAIGQKNNTTVCFVPDVSLIKEDKKWILV